MNAVAAVLAALGARIAAVSPAPGPLDLLVVGVVVAAAVLWHPLWRRLRHGITIVHEAGHGFAATITRRRLSGIRLHSDTSGLTVSVGRPRGPGMVLTLAAGYPAPSAAGVLAAWAVGAGHAAAALWAALVLLALVLVQIRNWFGLLSVLVSGALVAAATWWLDPVWRMRIALALTALLLIGGLRAAIELGGARRRDRRGTSDADQLARISVLPGGVWTALFVLASLLALAGGVLLLHPPLPHA
ncbi:MAG TPA: M50 family metallopeptidase [Amnibacterium sp.]|uniref:M50 family metallopeptidase n=1 Tax=Amnibacterium sp. TaxID=1872496 RepID=UPI002F95DDCF